MAGTPNPTLIKLTPKSFSPPSSSVPLTPTTYSTKVLLTHSKPPRRTFEWITTRRRHLLRIGEHGAVQSTKEQQRTSNNASRLPRPSEHPRWPVASTLQHKPQFRCPALTVPVLSGLGVASSATFEPTQLHRMNNQ